MKVKGEYDRRVESEEGKRGIKRVPRGKEVEVYYMCMYEDSTKKPTKHCLKRWEGLRQG
jgi:hypothetical protein